MRRTRESLLCSRKLASPPSSLAPYGQDVVHQIRERKRKKGEESKRVQEGGRERENRGKQNNKLKDYEAFAVERVRERVCK